MQIGIDNFPVFGFVADDNGSGRSQYGVIKMRIRAVIRPISICRRISYYSHLQLDARIICDGLISVDGFIKTDDK